MSSVDDHPPRERPERVMRFYIEGRQVDAEAFWQLIRDCGGQALVTAHPPRPLDGGYRLTAKGRAAVANEDPGA